MKKILGLLSILLICIILTGCYEYKDTYHVEDVPSPTKLRTTIDNNLSFDKTHFYDMLKKNGPLTQKAAPSVGNIKVLVIPISFESELETDEELERIDKVFNSTDGCTNWESVASYYKKSSYGRLNFQFDIPDKWYKPVNSFEYYVSKSSNAGAQVILREILSYYDSTYDYNDYDCDHDGYLDAIWLIPNSKHAEEVVNSLLEWAFTDWYSIDNSSFDGVKPSCYSWGTSQFITPSELVSGKSYTRLNLDPRAFIHETGHLLGLDDYYDYSGISSPLLGYDIMDCTVGDHGSISKLLLGWIDPVVVTGKGTTNYFMLSFAKTGDCLLIANHSLNSIYDEYFLLEYYTGDGLDAFDRPLGDKIGIRLNHIDAHKLPNSILSVNPIVGGGSSGFLYNNTYTTYRFAETLYGHDVEEGKKVPDNPLFDINSGIFGIDRYPEYLMNNQTSCNFEFEIIEMLSMACKIRITIK